MSEAREVVEWNQTSLIAVILANANRDADKRPRPYELADFHPFLKPKKTERRTGAELLAKLASFDGVSPEVVTEHTSWVIQKP